MNRSKVIEEIILDFERVNLLINQGKYKEATKLANTTYGTSKSIHYKEGINTYFNRIIFILYYSNQYVIAISLIKNLVIEYNKANNYKGVAMLYNLLGVILSFLSDYDGSIFYLKKSVLTSLKIEPVDDFRISSVHLGIANNYFNQNQNEKSLENIQSGLEYFKTKKDIEESFTVYFYLNIGQMLIMLKNNKIKKATKVLSSLIIVKKEFTIKEQAYLEQIRLKLLIRTDYDSTELIIRCEKLLNVSIKIQDNELIIEVYKFLKQHYLNIKNFEKALVFSNKIVKHYAGQNEEASILHIKEFNKEDINFSSDYIFFPKKEVLKVAKYQENFNMHSLQSKKISLKTHYKSSKYLSGDYLGSFNLDKEENYYLFVLADVVSEGSTSSYITFMLDGIIKSILYNASIYDLKSIVKDINHILSESLDGQGYVSLWAGILDLSEGTLESVNAGLIPTFLMSNSKIISLNKGCTILGMFDELPKIESEILKFKKGDALFSFSEGVKGAVEDSSETLETVIGNIIKRYSEDESLEFKSVFNKEINKLKKKYKVEEDISYLQIEYNN